VRPALLAAALLFAVQPAPPAGGVPAAVVDHSCKPLAPFAVTLSPRGDGAHVTIDVSIRPVLEMRQVSWRWELSPELQLVGGAAEGRADGTRGALTSESVQLLVPVDGRHARAVLRVSGQFLGHDELGQPALEAVEVEQAVEWGPAPAPAQVLLTPDDETGAEIEVVAVPAALRSGR
jgi:hypothetical protein